MLYWKAENSPAYAWTMWVRAHFEHQHTVKIMRVHVFTVTLLRLCWLLGTCVSLGEAVLGSQEQAALFKSEVLAINVSFSILEIIHLLTIPTD